MEPRASPFVRRRCGAAALALLLLALTGCSAGESLNRLRFTTVMSGEPGNAVRNTVAPARCARRAARDKLCLRVFGRHVAARAGRSTLGARAAAREKHSAAPRLPGARHPGLTLRARSSLQSQSTC
ncbi:hypothetical protein EYF80_063862 [Liparis tanakae]|uniref:Uncharacterized protein n=1 Tax=Liparis tanakae TaxID=230148 RepID=A0A4Z2ECH8_9TELE|nr:hypothetical protein EYF80_063862 [Liparis tanakae]